MQATKWFSEWMDALAAGLLAAMDRLARRRRFRLGQGAEGFVVTALDGGSPRPVGTVRRSGDEIATLPAGLDRSLAGALVDIEAPPGAVLVRRLEPLPAESRAFVDGIVRHQLERLMPWPLADILYEARVEPASGSGGRFDVTVAATSRAALAGAIAVAAALKPARARIVADDAPPITLPLGLDELSRFRSARRAAMAIAGALLLVLVVEAGWGLVAAATTGAVDADLDAAIADRRAVLRAAADAANRGNAAPDTLEGLKQSSPVAAVVLEALSRTLPDDAYLTELRLDGRIVRLTGLSHGVAELVPVLQGSPYFTGAAFFAPTVRMPGGEGDRFSVEATVEPRSEIAEIAP